MILYYIIICNNYTFFCVFLSLFLDYEILYNYIVIYQLIFET